MSSQDVVNFVSERIQNKSLMAICEEVNINLFTNI